MRLVVESLGGDQPVSQLHFGGGSPTFLSDPELERVVGALREAFRLERRHRDVDRGRPAHGDAGAAGELARAGLQPHQLRRAGLRPRRAAGGAPGAAVRKRARPDAQRPGARLSIDQCRPDLRVAAADRGELRAHGAADRRVEARPHCAVRLRTPARALQAAAPHPCRAAARRRAAGGHARRRDRGVPGRGYNYIGMDHFALADDSLSVAKRQGRLHRNFQGYSTQPDCDLIGLGVSSIGRVGATYYQNAKTLPEYYDAVRQGQLPVVRGFALTRDDLVRRAVIMALMCQGWVEFESIELAHLRARAQLLRQRARSSWRLSPKPGWSSSSRTAFASPRPAGTWCAPSRWCSTGTCRPTGCASASRA